MALELFPKSWGASLYTYAPVMMTIVHKGHELEGRELEGKLVPINRATNNANGKLTFLGLIKGLPVRRMAWYFDKTQTCHLAFATVGGSLIRVSEHEVRVPADFFRAAAEYKLVPRASLALNLRPAAAPPAPPALPSLTRYGL